MKPHKLFKRSFGLLSKVIVLVFILAGLLCFINFSFAKPRTVNESFLTPTITASTASGYIYACAGSPSASPYVQQFTFSAANLTNQVVVNAPAGFEVSLTAGGGYNIRLIFAGTGGSVSPTMIYVRSATTATVGIKSNNIVLTTTGATNTKVAVLAVITALPSANTVANQTLTTGTNTTAVNFSGNAKVFSWVNDTTGIGLAASGTGNISSFTTVNNGTSPVTATITVTPSTPTYAYVPNDQSDFLSVIDVSTNTVVSTITGAGGLGVAVSPDGSRVYVCDNAASIHVISTATNSVIHNITVGTNIEKVAINPDGSRLYAGDSGTGNLYVIDTKSLSVIATIGLSVQYNSIVMSPDGATAYVVYGRIGVINTSTNTMSTSIPVGDFPYGISITPDGSKLYVTDFHLNTVSVVNTSTNMVTATIPVGSGPIGVAINPGGQMVYVTNQHSNTVSVINTATNMVVATISVGVDPTGVSVSPDGSEVYVTNLGNPGAGTISVINTTTNAVIKTIYIGGAPIAGGSFINSNGSCPGVPTSFTITVNPIPPVVSVTGTPSTLTTNTGHASIVTTFNVSGTHIASGILVTPPSGFEISTSSTSGFGPSVTIGASGTIPSTPVYLRLAAADAVGSYSGNVVCSAGSASVNVPTGADAVNATANANLTGLKLSGGTLSPAFASGITSYSDAVVNSKTSITVTPTALDPAAVIKVNGTTVPSGGTSGAIALSVGGNTITILVTGHDGTTNTYSVTVTRAASANAKLSNLALSAGTLSPVFSATTTSYSATVSNATASVTETPTASDPTATIKVNGTTVATGHASGAIALNYGSNTITTVVTAQDGTTTKTYTVTVTRTLSPNDNLSLLKVSGGTLTPAFSSAIINYTDTVNNLTTQMTVTPTASYAGAGITVNGTAVASGTASQVIPLNVGNTAITIVVTAQSGATKTYTVTVNRPMAGGANPPGSSKSLQSQQHADDGIVIHQGLSPNGDGANDFLTIDGITKYPDNKLMVMNRSGILVFEAKGYDNTSKRFDGRSSKTGKMQQPGTYFYALEYKANGVTKRKTGFVVLKW